MIEEEKTVNDEQSAAAEGTNEDPKQGASEESGAAQDEGDGLDALLAEFEDASPKEADTAGKMGGQSQSKPKDDTPPLDVSALAALEQRLNDQESREQRRDLENLFSNMSSGTNGDMVDAEAYLNAIAARNPSLIDVYNNRVKSPDKWAKAEKEIMRDFTKRHGKKVDKQATEGREAVTSAVRSAQSAAPTREYTDKDVENASPDEWADIQRKLGITPI